MGAGDVIVPGKRERTAGDEVRDLAQELFDKWETDFGRTCVLGDDPARLRLRDALPSLFAEGRRLFDRHPNLTAEQLYARVRGLAGSRHWILELHVIDRHGGFGGFREDLLDL
ncbi:hypothetical protein ACIHCM_36010 [Streptomyces sp. NPDC052023]|uniref:hypothetical protein n=1 Tax=Streptomyces sp. NPDC052023 TaxID=3365681 RepID=UPI0037D31024